jgi:hypothetical protein
MVMLRMELTQTRNSFAALDQEVPGAFVLGGFPNKIGYRGTCIFVLGSVSLSGGFYLRFRSSELPERLDHSTSPAVIIGSSMVRNISVSKAKTLCYPGA